MARFEEEQGGQNTLWAGFRLSGEVDKPFSEPVNVIREDLVHLVQRQGAMTAVAEGPIGADVARVALLPLLEQRRELTGFVLSHALIRDHAPTRREVCHLQAQWETAVDLLHEVVGAEELRRLDATLWLSDVRGANVQQTTVEDAVAARAPLPACSIVAARCIAFPDHLAVLPAAARHAIEGACIRPYPGISAAVARGIGYRSETLATLRYFGHAQLAAAHAEGGEKLLEHERAALIEMSRGVGDTTLDVLKFDEWE